MTDNKDWNKSSYYGDEDDDPDRGTVYGRRTGSGPFYGGADDDYDDDEDDLEEEEKEEKDSSSSDQRSSYGGSSYSRDRYSSSPSYGGSSSNYGSSSYGSGSSSRYGGSGSSGSYGGSTYGVGSSSSPESSKPSKSKEGGGVGAVLGRIGLGKKSDKPAAPRRSSSEGGLGARLSGLRSKLPGGKGKAASSSTSPGSSYGSRASSVRTVDRGGSDRGSSDRGGRDRDGKSGGKSRFGISLPFLRRGAGSARPSQPPTRRGGKRPKDLPKSSRTPRIKNEGLSIDAKLDIAGWGLLILSAIIFFGAISSNPGDLSGTLLRLIYQLVGIGWLAVPFALGATGVWLIWRRFGENVPEADAVKIAGYVVFYLGLLTTFQFVHLLSTPVFNLDQLRTVSEQAALQGYGGGWIGSTAYLFLMQNLGDVGTFFALLGWLGAGLILATDLTLVGIFTALRELLGRLVQRYQFARSRRATARGALPTPTQPEVERLPQGGVAALSSRTSASQALSSSDAIPVEKPAPLIRRHRADTVGVEAEAETGTAASGASYEPPSRVAPPSTRYQPFTERAAPASRIEPAAPDEEELEEAEVYTAPGYAGREYGDSRLPLKRGEDILRVRRPYYDEDEDDDLEDTPTTGNEDESESVAEERTASPVVGSPPARPAFYDRPAFHPANDTANGDGEDEEPEEDQPASQHRDSGYGLTQAAHYTEPAPPPAYDDEEADEEDLADLEEFSQPARPRDPDRVRQLRPLRERGAGLSPAEAAALAGSFAAADDEDDEVEDEVEDITLDEPIYEALDEPVADDDELDVIEIDEPAAPPERSRPPFALDADDEDEDADEDEDMVIDMPARPVETPAQRTAPPPVERPPAQTPVQPAAQASPAPRSQPVPAAAEPDLENAPAMPEPVNVPEWHMPDFRRVLDPAAEQNINDELLLDRARIIEDTLASFGAPGKVVEVNPGPAITQFGVEPDYVEGRGGKRTRVKVQAIARLADDLALSLAARSIRIEAPVPGKGFVGIEVPNAETALVSLRDIMEGPEFARLDTKLRIGLGQSVDGTPVAADLTAMPHLLIAGTTGSGKSVCVNAIIACLLLENTPDDLRMIMVDPKRVELTGYNGIPHLVAPVVVDLERIVGVLKWVTREMDDRYRKFNERGARNILSYNQMLLPGEKKLPYLIVIIDELADLMMLAPDETERVLTRLAQMARATGIHLIISTQRPSVDVVTGLIKANFPARIAFAVASSVDSRVILDQPGAERLLGRGDMLFQAPDAAAPARLQGVFVSDTELTRLVNHWKGLRPIEEAPRPAAALETGLSSGAAPSRGSLPTVQSRGEKYSPPPAPARATTTNNSNFWDEVTNASAERRIKPAGDDVDDLYDEAVAVVRRLKKASVSLLQRQLRIGYTRAARLIDVMEERGVVGPAQSGSKPRKVIGYSDDDIDLSDDDEDEEYLDDEDFEDDDEE